MSTISKPIKIDVNERESKKQERLNSFPKELILRLIENGDERKSVLDYGCGDGSYSAYIFDKNRFDVCGVDVASYSFVSNRYRQITDLSEIDVTEPYDVIFMNYCIPYVPYSHFIFFNSIFLF